MTSPSKQFSERLDEILDTLVGDLERLTDHRNSDTKTDAVGNLYAEAKAAITQLVSEGIGETEVLITPENYDKFNKNNTTIFYENRARDVRNTFRAGLRKTFGIEEEK